jgi:isoleucyl-tRNA synthetase
MNRLYEPVDPQVSFPEMERRVLEAWRERDIFKESMRRREGAEEWVFYEGPPTANARPGIHHVEARAFKDIFCRFQTMRGRYVHRKGGWDCHGLPVEIQVEKELGITEKREIEDRIGIAAFIERCRESVRRYVDEWERLTDRMGFWVDLADAYWTMSPAYVESAWWILKQIWDNGLLEEDFKVVPYCPRCETALSNHEQHQPGAYQTIVEPSVYIRFPMADKPEVALLVWTTTPWTLLANMAAAVHPDVTYARVPDPARAEGHLILAKERVGSVLGEETTIEEEMTGTDLIDRRYEPPFDFVESGGTGHRVRPGEFVTTDEGSGIVHLAPYGEDDMVVAKRDALPIVQIIDGAGRVTPQGGKFAGMWFKEADPKIVEDLHARGRLLRSEDYEHAYPHCWRCNTPLLYYARKDWYIRTSQVRDRLQASNEATNWQPPSVKHGRFGDWLANNVDWSLSRDRYWGTPLPIWRCEEGHSTCIGSFAELKDLTGRDMSGFDPHRPYVDEISFGCPECGKEARRVRFVIDTWFDSGAMPFAQWHYPFENQDIFNRRFPADFISEAIDQTRGWFYTLLAVATLIRGENSYRNVVCLGLIVDAEGRKMSKSLGNVLDPWTVFETQGADALRWYLLTAGSPWAPRRVSAEILHDALRKYLLTMWNTYSFWITYASLEGFDPTVESIPLPDRPEMDRWILAELDDTIRVTTRGLESFDATTGGRRLDRFVDDLSNWYVRRNRRRFWRSSEEVDTRAAFQTLWECLVTLAKLTAPYTPFIADEIYRNLSRPDESAPASVHLADWPEPDPERVDDPLRSRMELARRLVTLGRAARTEAGIRVRQPLARALMVVPGAHIEAVEALSPIVAEELNVKEIEVVKGIDELVSYSVKPNFKALGPRFGPRVKDVARALAEADAHDIVAALDGKGTARVRVGVEEVSLEAEELDVRVEGRTGFSLAQDGPYGVALDLEITAELRAEGLAREVVRAIQDLRKASGLAVEDRIQLWLDPRGGRAASAVDSYREYIAAEVLATATEITADLPADAASDDVAVDGATVRLALRRA